MSLKFCNRKSSFKIKCQKIWEKVWTKKSIQWDKKDKDKISNFWDKNQNCEKKHWKSWLFVSNILPIDALKEKGISTKPGFFYLFLFLTGING